MRFRPGGALRISLCGMWLFFSTFKVDAQTEALIRAEIDGEEAVYQRLEIVKDATLARDWKTGNRSWLERVIAEPFAKKASDQVWQKEAVIFLTDALDHWRAGEMRQTHPKIA